MSLLKTKQNLKQKFYIFLLIFMIIFSNVQTDLSLKKVKKIKLSIIDYINIFSAEILPRAIFLCNNINITKYFYFSFINSKYIETLFHICLKFVYTM